MADSQRFPLKNLACVTLQSEIYYSFISGREINVNFPFIQIKMNHFPHLPWELSPDP